MNTTHSSIQALGNFLKNLPTNKPKIAENASPKIIELLQICWQHLDGSEENNTDSGKIYRAENLRWSPPLLYLELERHGATVNGSSRAEVHHWAINVNRGTAQIVKVERRQLTKMSPRMDVKAKAREIADVIFHDLEHPSIQWDDNKLVVIIAISQIIPETVAQTTQSRRKRFRVSLDSILLEQGWERKKFGNKLAYMKIENK
jgi:hypothetical protein